jgi:2-polyprenyl-3-methyl-5-hydroxy-6-metoxy-1,4-benzoquinol methylase
MKVTVIKDESMEARKILAFNSASNKDYLAGEQYAGMSNYQHRKDIQKYSDNGSLFEWYATQYSGNYNLAGFNEILEIGCGDGTFWKHVVNEQTFKPHVVITDLSGEMLETCKHNLLSVKMNVRDFK